MLVLDASVVCDLLLKSRFAPAVGDLLAKEDVTLHAPSIVMAECLSVARRHRLRGALAADGLEAFVDDLFALPVGLHLLDEASAQRAASMFENVTATDAAYVVLAEALDAALVTSDARLAKAAARYCEVITFEG